MTIWRSLPPGEVRAQNGIGEQVVEHLLRPLQIRNRLEEGRDVERQVVGRAEPAERREPEHREHVVDVTGHRDDVRAEGVRAVGAQAFGDRPEDLERPRRARARRAESVAQRPHVRGLQIPAQPLGALSGRPRRPGRIPEQVGHDVPELARVLTGVEDGHVEAERADATDEPTHAEEPRVNASVALEALGDGLDVGQQLRRARVGVLAVGPPSPPGARASDGGARGTPYPRASRARPRRSPETTPSSARRARIRAGSTRRARPTASDAPPARTSRARTRRARAHDGGRAWRGACRRRRWGCRPCRRRPRSPAG